jgi:pimeloyl-ACP methyl ester carboxylesterase
MNTKMSVQLRRLSAGAATALILLTLTACVSQRHDQVLIRPPGATHYDPPADIVPTAQLHWQYSFMSAVAYESSFYETLANDAYNAPSPSQAPSPPLAQIQGKCPDFSDTLKNLSWEYWPIDFHTEKARQLALKHHFRVHVFARASEGSLQVVVAFGGTDPRNVWDWFSNLRWFFPMHDDEYTIVVKDFAGAFQGELRRQLTLRRISDDHVSIASVGHSLGGGLAQQLAYAAKQNAGDLRVSQVYAFDPSPVTGFYSVAKNVRDDSRIGLKTDRAFEEFEILSYLRWVTAHFYPPSTVDPAVRSVRYRVLSTEDGIRSHSLTDLACALYAKANPSIPAPPTR